MFSALSTHPPDALVVEMLRAIEHGIRVLDWRQIGKQSVPFPVPIRLAWDPPVEGALRGDVLDWDQAASFFGWEAEMSAYFDN